MILDSSQYTIAKNIHGIYAVPIESAYTFTSSTILRGRVHEPCTIDYIVQNCGTGDIIHAGAGFGDFLPALSKACVGNVFTFEPNTVNCQACQETIHLNNLTNVALSKHGISHESSHRHLRIKEDALALGVRSELTEPLDTLTRRYLIESAQVQEVSVDTLDNLVLPHSQRVSIIHLDIEGYEFDALFGAKKLIERDHPIIILEIDGRALDYNRQMKEIGYKPAAQLIYDAGEMVFVNTVYKRSPDES